MTPEEKAAHLARLEYMEEMGLGHWSITNPKVCVRMFRRIVQREERAKCIGEMEQKLRDMTTK